MVALRDLVPVCGKFSHIILQLTDFYSKKIACVRTSSNGSSAIFSALPLESFSLQCKINSAQTRDYSLFSLALYGRFLPRLGPPGFPRGPFSSGPVS
jgi:hypothetical protein